MRDRKRIDPGGREGEEDLGGVEGAIFNRREKSLPTQKIVRQFYQKKKKGTNFKTTGTTTTKVWMRRD